MQRPCPIGMSLWQENNLVRALPSLLAGVPFTLVRTQIKWVKCLPCLCSCSSASITQTCSFLSISFLGKIMQIMFDSLKKTEILPQKREMQNKMQVVMCLFCGIPVNDVCSQLTVLGRSCRAVPLEGMAGGAH